jgi:hypothetical protein
MDSCSLCFDMVPDDTPAYTRCENPSPFTGMASS